MDPDSHPHETSAGPQHLKYIADFLLKYLFLLNFLCTVPTICVDTWSSPDRFLNKINYKKMSGPSCPLFSL